MAKQQPRDRYFRMTEEVPGEVWYWAAVVSILASLGLQIAGKKNESLFVGQWPPTFLLFALYHKLLGR